MLTLGIPFKSHNGDDDWRDDDPWAISPGPRVMTDRPGLFWVVIVGMWIGNLILVVLNLPLVGLWVKLLRVPYRFHFPSIVVFCCIDTYNVSSNVFDL